MWHTSAGDRTLEGAESLLIREAIGWVVDMLGLETGDPTDFWLFGIPAFDQLAPQQKLALLCEVSEALLRPDMPPPNLTALNEATVGVLYQSIRQCLEMEIDHDVPEEFGGPDMRHWRRLVVAALAEAGPAVIDRTALPSPDCPDLEKWGLLIETLDGQVLWDADWLDEDLFLDADPNTTAALKQELGITGRLLHGDRAGPAGSGTDDDPWASSGVRRSLRAWMARWGLDRAEAGSGAFARLNASGGRQASVRCLLGGSSRRGCVDPCTSTAALRGQPDRGRWPSILA